jgi:HK97 family phage major capsid protein
MDAVTQERDLLEKRARVYEGMRAIMEKMEQGIELDTDDRAEFDKRNKKITKLNEDIERVRTFTRLSAGANEAREEAETRDAGKPAAQVDAERAYEIAFLKYMRDGDAEGMTTEQRNAWRAHSKPQSLNYAPTTRNYRADFDSHGTERRAGFAGLCPRTIDYDGFETRAALDANALSTAPLSSGVSAGATGYDAGYLVPQGFWHNLQIALKAYGGLLPYIQLLQTDSGQPMPWPTVDPTAIVGRYITEQNQLGYGGDSNGGDYQFGQGMLNAWTIVSGVILASLQLINDAAFDVDGFVNDRIGESIGRKVAAEIHTGSGSSAFLGIETALSARGHQASPALGGVYLAGSSTNWASTAGGSAFTIAGGTSAQAKRANGLIGFDDVLGMIATVDPAYRNSGRCIFVANDLTLAMLRQITDAYGHPLWSPAVAPGQPDTLYGFPVVIDQNTSAVSTSASTAGGLLFGDFKTAMVGRQVNGASMMRLTERYADYLQVGYLGYVRMDVRSNDLRAAAIFSTNSAS